jgi:hypothetical protein
MIKFWLVSRPPDDMDRAEFDFHWSCIHVALMVSTPTVMRGFQRYTQHRVADGATPDLLPYGAAEADWYNISEHWLHGLPALMEIFQSEDYRRRMLPHKFGGGNSLAIELTSGEVLYDQPTPFTGRGGVKLVNFLVKSDSLDQDAFASTWRDSYAPQVLRSARADGQVKRYVQNPQLPLDASAFAGTLFEAGGVQTYAGIEELWFEDLASLRSYAHGAGAELRSEADNFVDGARSFSMTVVERVVYDYTSEQPSRRPAIEDPDSLEASILRQERGWGEWNKIQPVTS